MEDRNDAEETSGTLPGRIEAHGDGETDRQSQPVDAEQPPRLPFPVVGIGASAGGLEAVSALLSTLPSDSGMAFVLVQHLPPTGESLLVEILSKRTNMPVRQVENRMAVEADHLYVIRPGNTLIIRDGVFHLGERVAIAMHNRPVDDFFKSLAEEQRERAIGILLSGMGSNGSAGAQAIKAVGGLCIAQDPETAEFPSMPRHLIDAGYADYVLRPQDMSDMLISYASHPYTRGEREIQQTLAIREQQQVREILAVLRTRTRHDFTGYKKPTVVRRIQRRMGLNRLNKFGEYAKLLRQSPSEVTALADDLLIHVTGFFRDAESWEALRTQVIVPLIAACEPERSVRAWVTACSSGEEAYTLAILMVEEADRVGKRLDIKVFATDMAERSLANARGGTYPGGIESEIEPNRLERFFQKEDAIYRVRPELRERVVFAPQNLLQDPPFSRLDIATCRNLLIYLEPEVQKRVLGMLHFGLRDGGVLFLGTSETIAGADEMFEPIDKKARIYRRVGPTRHGTVEFPLPHGLQVPAGSLAKNAGPASSDSRWGASRPSIAQMTSRALLEHHTPAAVTIDRDGRIVFYHGNTETFVTAPRGEPTRDLMPLVREGLRSAVRSVLQQAASHNSPSTSVDAWIEKQAGGPPTRVTVTASPLDLKNAPDYLVLSFQERGDQLPAHAEGDSDQAAAGTPPQIDDLRRIRDELQSTIEELQSSNEELKASHEEVVSVNEELQSTNEELETSREEMQSLNEELATVNAQLHAKVEEHRAASNDLASLLTSTDIAVLFLDTRFSIRRFTPQVRELIDLLASDVGRPLSDLAKKFIDPELQSDVEAVLNRLTPIEREISAANDTRWFLRRVTPYRTVDHRIDGVVIAFIEITARRQAEKALRESEERFRLLVEGARDFAMILLDANGQITAWNAGAERLLGHAESDAIGKFSSLIFTPEDRKSGVPEREMAESTVAGRINDERWHVRKNGERFWGSGSTSTLRNADSSVRGYVKILRDETTRKRAEQALQVAKEAAESANRAKDEFLASLSHELRTPLTAMLLWAKVLLGPGASDPVQLREGLIALNNSAEAQKELIEDLLDVSRITRGDLRLRLRNCELVPVVHDALDAIAPIALAKGVALMPDLDAQLGFVYADPDRLRQVLWNLLTNAVKFTAAGGRVEVGLQRQVDAIELRVTDTGRGISPDFLPYVFDRFRQADASHDRSFGGIGLGLAIVKALVELHGGTITAESPGIDEGATFRARLPLLQARDAAGSDSLVSDSLPPAIQPATASGKRSGRLSGKPSVKPFGAARAKQLSGRRVLLVEDDRETRSGIATVMRSAGIEVTETDSAAAAVAAFERARPDLILSDIGLPGEDGHSLIRHIRAQEAAANSDAVPAVALTAFARESDRRAAIAAGFQEHLRKPIEPEQLLSVISGALSGETPH